MQRLDIGASLTSGSAGICDICSLITPRLEYRRDVANTKHIYCRMAGLARFVAALVRFSPLGVPSSSSSRIFRTGQTYNRV
eukprot:5977285-Pyramimonas_sp.AAC.1